MAITNLGTGGSALDAQSGSTSGADTNDPTWLGHDGTNYIYLPGGSNSVSCTAPGTAASYAAYPLGGGAPTTGAATGGAAFTFSTSGSWERVDLLNGSAVVVASFVAPATGASTGGTDAYGVTWAINRSTSGRKAVAVTAPVWLFGTDDYLEVADNADLDFGASDSFTVLAVVRQWATGGIDQTFISKQIQFGSYDGWTLSRFQGFAAGAFAEIASLTSSAVAALTTWQAGDVVAAFARLDRATDVLTVSDGASSNTASTAAVGDISTTYPVRVGTSGAGPNYYADMELLAVAVWRRALTDAEIAAVTTFYQNRWP